MLKNAARTDKKKKKLFDGQLKVKLLFYFNFTSFFYFILLANSFSLMHDVPRGTSSEL